MIRKLVLLIILMIAVCMPTAFAEGMGVQLIPPPDTEGAQPVSLDDLKLEEAAEIEDWGIITLTECKYLNRLYQYKQGKDTVDDWNWFDSGVEADYLIVKANILNTTVNPMDYLKDCEVKLVFNDSAEFLGWSHQYNWDNASKDLDWGDLNGKMNKEFFIDAADQFEINSWYEGHYCFGCTLPNAVVNGTYPLRMEIKIGGNEITYHLRAE